MCIICLTCERLCPPVDRRRTQLCAWSQHCRSTGNVFSSESSLWGMRIWILVCTGVKLCSMKHQGNLVVCQSSFLSWILVLLLFPLIFFLSFPISSKASTLCLLPPSQPCLLGSSFSERVPHSLGQLTCFERGDVTTHGCVSLFKCTEFEVLYTSVSKHTCFWSQHINMIYFQF